MTQTTSSAVASIPAASGKVVAVKDGVVVFTPAGTSYELYLAVPNYTGPLNTPVKCLIRVGARKVYTVASGGNFIAPIFGPPRIVQGLVRSGNDKALIVHAGCPIYVDLPTAESGIDLDDGPIWAGRMVNVACLPGARAEFL
jgi:hypothetical protein